MQSNSNLYPPWLEKILKFTQPYCCMVLQTGEFGGFIHHGWRKIWNLHLWNGWKCFKLVLNQSRKQEGVPNQHGEPDWYPAFEIFQSFFTRLLLPRVNKILKAPTTPNRGTGSTVLIMIPSCRKRSFVLEVIIQNKNTLSFFLRNVENIGEYSRKYKNTGEY